MTYPTLSRNESGASKSGKMCFPVDNAKRGKIATQPQECSVRKDWRALSRRLVALYKHRNIARFIQPSVYKDGRVDQKRSRDKEQKKEGKFRAE